MCEYIIEADSVYADIALTQKFSGNKIPLKSTYCCFFFFFSHLSCPLWPAVARCCRLASDGAGFTCNIGVLASFIFPERYSYYPQRHSSCFPFQSFYLSAFCNSWQVTPRWDFRRILDLKRIHTLLGADGSRCWSKLSLKCQLHCATGQPQSCLRRWMKSEL